jgi:putative nucleotidyltransferase with HDIG domain
MDGLDLLRSVRGKHPHIGFIMATGAGDIRSGVQAMKDGADDYLQKPLDFDALTVTLNRVLKQKKLEVEVENYRANLEKIVEERTRQLMVATRRIELSYDDTLEALAAALDLRDNETAGHSRRVMVYSVEIAGAMGCDHEHVKTIARAALLHDIGKIGIPDSILLLPDPFTEKQRLVMETHVRIGYELLSRVAFLAGPAEIVLTHHERFYGTGYPQGLQSTEIPLGARIFAVADALDAITSDRPYRRAQSYGAAREEIARWSGRQFDPAVVSAFLSIGETVWQAIRQEKGNRVSAGMGRIIPAHIASS